MKYESKFSLKRKYGMEDFYYGTDIKWKKTAGMEYGKIFFHSIPCLAFTFMAHLVAN